MRTPWYVGVMVLSTWLTAFDQLAVAQTGAPIRWRTDFAQAQAEARATGKLLLVNIHTSWCAPCRKLKSTTLRDPSLATLISQHCIPVSLDGERDAATIQNWQIRGFPTQLFLTADGQIVDKLIGYANPQEYASVLHRAVRTAGISSLASAAPPTNRTVTPPQTPMPRQELSPPTISATSNSAGLPTQPAVSRQEQGQIAREPSPSQAFPQAGQQDYARLTNNLYLRDRAQSPTRSDAQPSSTAPASRWPSQALTQPPSWNRSSQQQPMASAVSFPRAMTPPQPPAEQRTRAVKQTAACDPSAPVALNGFCPVSMIERAVLLRGSQENCLTYQGHRYLLHGQQERALFERDPERYLPGENGICVVSWVDDRVRRQGQIQYPALFGDHVYFFASEANRQQFLHDPERYVDERSGQVHHQSFSNSRETSLR